MDKKNKTAYIMGIERLRDNVDGCGLRTLVLFDSCPLACDYCLNRLLMQSGIRKRFSPESLMEILKIDEALFLISGGGVTFGGGEPALQSEFIAAFAELNQGSWPLAIETSLNVAPEHVFRLSRCIDEFFVDIKDMNPVVYRSYTGVDGRQAYYNLKWLVSNGFASKITVRVPLIPGYNDKAGQQKSLRMLKAMGLKTEAFSYILPDKPVQKKGTVSVTLGIPTPDKYVLGNMKGGERLSPLMGDALPPEEYNEHLKDDERKG